MIVVLVFFKNIGLKFVYVFFIKVDNLFLMILIFVFCVLICLLIEDVSNFCNFFLSLNVGCRIFCNMNFLLVLFFIFGVLEFDVLNCFDGIIFFGFVFVLFKYFFL